VRILRWAFVVGIAIVAVGLALVSTAAVAAGSWWQARQPLIGLGLDSLVVGLAVVHLSAPPLIFMAAARSQTRGAVAIGLLIAAGALAFLATGVPGMPIAVYVLLLAGWVVAATAVMAWRQSQSAWITAAVAALVVGPSSLLLAAWWWVISWGLPTRVPGAERPPPSLLEDAGTIMYSRPDLALLMPGLPTLALLAVGVLVLLSQRARRTGLRRAADAPPVLT
jgi:hypothetical protein